MFEDESYHYIVTEYLNGKDALDLLIAQKNIDEGMAFNIFYHCLLALNYLHTNKVMHRYISIEIGMSSYKISSMTNNPHDLS